MNFDVTLTSSQLNPASFVKGQKTTIEQIPQEVIISIFYLLKISQLGIVSLVNKAWSKLTKEETLWKALYQRDSVLFKINPTIKTKNTWCETYKAAWRSYLLDDTEFVRGKVQRHGLFLKFASDRLKGDLETVKLAVQQNILALQFASDGLKESPEVIRTGLVNIQKNNDIKDSIVKYVKPSELP